MTRRMALVAAAAGMIGCGQVLGLGDFEDAPAGEAATTSTAATSGSGGATATTSTTSATSGTGGAGGATTATGGGAGGDGGHGGAPFCDAGTTEPCYGGPAGTEGVGVCAAGEKTCLPDGTDYGPCTGEVGPAPESCATLEDDDCDGTPNDGCVCTPGTTASCYTGPGGTEGVGVCAAGTQTCVQDGSGYGACGGEVLPSTENCALVEDEDCSGYACGQAVWSAVYGDASFQFARAMATDAAGNVYLIGQFKGTITFGANTLVSAGDYDVFVAKLDAAGVPVWSVQFGDVAAQDGMAIAVDGGGGVFLGGYSSGTIAFGANVLQKGVFLAKLAANGAPVWSRSLGGDTGASAADVAIGPTGDAVYVGQLVGTMDLGSGSVTDTFAGDAYVLKAAGATGSTLWNKHFDNANGVAIEPDLNGVAIDGGGNVTLTGTFSSDTNLGGATLSSLDQDDILVARYTALGTHVWSKRFGGALDQGGGDVAVDGAGNLYVAAGNAGTLAVGGTSLVTPTTGDGALFKLDTNGSAVWAVALGEQTGSGAITHVALDSLGNIAIAGYFDGTLTLGANLHTALGSTDLLIAQLTSNGGPVWSSSFGSAGTEAARGLGFPADGARLLAHGTGTLDFGLGVLATAGSYDVFVARFSP